MSVAQTAPCHTGVQSADCPAGKFKALDEILYDQSVPGLAELVPYCNGTDEAGTDADAGRPGADTPGPASSPAARTAGAAAAAEGGTLEPTPLPEGREGQGEEAQAEDGAALQGVGDTAAAAAAECAAGPPVVPSLASLRQQLACVCDVRRIDDDCCYYRLNDQRVGGCVAGCSSVQAPRHCCPMATAACQPPTGRGVCKAHAPRAPSWLYTSTPTRMRACSAPWRLEAISKATSREEARA